MEISAKGLDELQQNVFNKRAQYEEASDKAKEIKKELEQLQDNLIGELEALDRVSHKTSTGTVSYRYDETFRVPKGEESRQLFFGYLRDKGIFDDMITVNSKTLNSYAKEEAEVEEKNGNYDFQIPGLEKSPPRLIVSLRRNK